MMSGFFTHSAASSVYDVDTVAYRARVIADGGAVINLLDVDKAIRHAKAYGYWTSVAFWTSAQFGVKKDESNAVSTLYDLKGNDASQSTGSAQPIWTANQQNGRAGIVFTRTSNHYLICPSALIPGNAVFSINFVFAPVSEAVVGGIVAQYAAAQTGRMTIAANQNSGGIATAGALNPFLVSTTSGGGVGGFLTHFAYSTPCLFSLTNSATAETLKSWKNGVEQDSGTAAVVYTSGNTSIGSFLSTSAFNPYNGKIYDIMILNSNMARVAIETFQNQKWAIY